MKRILVTGATGQIGSELTVALRRKYGCDNVIAVGHRKQPSETLLNSGPYETTDLTDKASAEKLVKKYEIDTIYHLAAILSATGEKNPQQAWNVNMGSLYNILEIAWEHRLTRLFWPSSIAVFGSTAPRVNTPQETVLLPQTMYGITKVAGELLCNYYFVRFGVDVRSLRYPGIISSEVLPGGGTTDYAVEIFYEAIKKRRYTCFVRKDTVLPMMYMPDCIKATIDLMEAEPSRVKRHDSYNVAGMSFSAGELAAEIKKYIPDFVCDYKPDFRQAIADSWPMSIDDSLARKEWGWKPDYDLADMVRDMIEKLLKRHGEGKL
ncbi:MAG: NAD-dependent epimerase/dehydratase family protein [Candidatus Bathyarchaeota archaeon]|nr:NAD-dependent epimerase/dehydratase family protein [Candidatus Bathyarchaeota archaeon]